MTWADKTPPDMTAADLCIDALLGIGISSAAPAREPDHRLLAMLAALQHSPAPVLAVDLPSGLDADTGQFAAGFALPAPPAFGRPVAPRHTLSLLTLKPGLFTAAGRDAAGSVWLDDLGVSPQQEPPVHGWPALRCWQPLPHCTPVRAGCWWPCLTMARWRWMGRSPS